MWIYLTLAAGVFMGWSLGANDAANAFGTAVATGVIRYRTAVAIIAVLVMIGAFAHGADNLTGVHQLAVNNAIIPSADEVRAQIAADNHEWLDTLVLKSSLRAAVIFTVSAIIVFIMTYLKFPASANQSITGAMIGWGLAHGRALRGENLRQIVRFVTTWLVCPASALLISFLLVGITNRWIVPKLAQRSYYGKIVRLGYLLAGVSGSYSIGRNSAANVTALYYGESVDGIRTNLLSDPRLTAAVGGLAIALGVLTYSQKVMMTVGTDIAPLTPVEGFVVIIAMSLTLTLMGDIMHIPVSSSQAIVGAVVGAGLTKECDCVNFGIFRDIALAWISSPFIAGLAAYLVALATKGFLA